MFSDACALLDAVLVGTARQEILDSVCRSGDFGTSLMRLRDRMRGNVWKVGRSGTITLDHIVKKYDVQIRRSGFHVLHDWDGIADRVNDDTIPIDVLNYLHVHRAGTPLDRRVLAMLIDYHFVNVLALLSMVIWDEGDADANLDCLNRLLDELQGPNGSGQRFVCDAETLLVIATSHYELNEGGFAPLLDQVRTLNRTHKAKIALSHAVAFGCHLRFGFEATYGRDTIVMRDDNVVDYPWLCFALVTLIREYSRGLAGTDQDTIIEGMLNGLTADARAFVGKRPPNSLSRCEADRAEFCDLFHEHRRDLLAGFDDYRPTEGAYSPLSFFFNFSHNVLKGIVVDALLRGTPWNLTFSDLLTARPPDEQTSRLKEELAGTLMGYARANPDRIRGRLMPVIVYDPQAGRRAYSVTMRKLQE